MSPKARPGPDAPEPEGPADLPPVRPMVATPGRVQLHPDGTATVQPDDGPEPEATNPDYLAPDGTPWATYLGTALGAFLADPLRQPAPWEQWRAWDAAGRPER